MLQLLTRHVHRTKHERVLYSVQILAGIREVGLLGCAQDYLDTESKC